MTAQALSDTAPRSIAVLCDLPYHALSPNARDKRAGRWQKIKAAKQYRHDCCMAAFHEMNGRQIRFRGARLVLFFLLGRTPAPLFDENHYKPRDVDNGIASAKACIDGLRDAGLLIGDEAVFLDVRACIIPMEGPGGWLVASVMEAL